MLTEQVSVQIAFMKFAECMFYTSVGYILVFKDSATNLQMNQMSREIMLHGEWQAVATLYTS